MVDIASNLGCLRDRIDSIARSCGRRPESIDLLAVSKTLPADAVEQAWAALAKGGTAVLLGLLPPGERIAIDPIRLMGHECILTGATYGSSVPTDDFGRLVDLYLAGRLMLDELVGQRYTLDEINEAHAALVAGGSLRGLLVYE